MYYIAHVTDLSTPISKELENLTFDLAIKWIEDTGNIIEYTIVKHK